MKIKKGDFVYLKKIEDTRFNGNHPNGIDVGYDRFGILSTDIEVGKKVHVENASRYLTTSFVTEIIDDNTFRTENSIYFITKDYENDKEQSI